jgi:hypothetical protein
MSHQTLRLLGFLALGLSIIALAIAFFNPYRTECEAQTEKGTIPCSEESATDDTPLPHVQNPIDDGGVQYACTMDAMQCPDGSYIGRTGPNCEFVCPEVKGASDEKTIIGSVLVGPTCAVVSDENVNACADKAYEGRITLTNADNQTAYDISTDETGMFRSLLPPGTYSISREGESDPLPLCSGTTVVTPTTRAITIMCESGIR